MQQADALHPVHAVPTATAVASVPPMVPESHTAGPAAAAPFDSGGDLSLHELAALATSPPRTAAPRDPASQPVHAGSAGVNQPADAARVPASAHSEDQQLGTPAALMVGEQLLALSRVASEDASSGGPPLLLQLGAQ